MKVLEVKVELLSPDFANSGVYDISFTVSYEDTVLKDHVMVIPSIFQSQLDMVLDHLVERIKKVVIAKGYSQWSFKVG